MQERSYIFFNMVKVSCCKQIKKNLETRVSEFFSSKNSWSYHKFLATEF